MPSVINQKTLNPAYWALSGPNLIRANLFGSGSRLLFVIDPQQISDLGGTKTSLLSGGNLSTLQPGFTTNATVIAANHTVTNWGSLGWSTSSGKWEQDIKRWVRINFTNNPTFNPSNSDFDVVTMNGTVSGTPYLVAMVYVGNHGSRVSDIQMSTSNASSAFIQAYDGSVWCCGNATSGINGDGTTQGRSSPVSVLGGRSYVFISGGIASGGSGTAAAIEGSTGNAYCWGQNNAGQCGDGTTQGRSSPVSVLGGRSFSTVTAAANNTLALEASTGNAWSWGAANSGSNGDNTLVSRSSPVSVVGGRIWSMVHNMNGTGNAIALEASTGNIYCWGPGGAGCNGDNTIQNRSSPTLVAGGRSYIYVTSGGGGFAAMAAIEGGTNLCYMWGGFSNTLSLGDGTTQNRSSPTAVLGNTQFTKVVTSGGSTFGLDINGNLWGWGAPSGGFGDNNATTSKSSPVMIVTGRTFKDIACGGAKFGLETGTDIVYSWGDNGNSAMGLGTNPNVLSPSELISDKTFSKISTRLGTTMALDSAGTAYDWGNGGHSSPVAVVTTSGPFSQIASGNSFEMALEAGTGVVWTWTLSGNGGAMGNNTTTAHLTPAAVVGGRSFSVIATAQNNAGFAIEGTTGNLYAWGTNGSGILGDTTTQARSSPNSVSGGRSYSLVAASGTQAVAIEGSTGFAWGWGSGNVGDGTTQNRSSPVSVQGGLSYSYVAGGFNQILAINGANGSLWAWGNNNSGNLGDGSTSGRSSPVSVLGGRSYIAAAGSLQTSYAIEGSTGHLYAWGAGALINLDLSTASTSSPVLVPGGQSFVALTSGNVVLALDGGGQVWGYGGASGGGLGNNTDSLVFSPTAIARSFT